MREQRTMGAMIENVGLKVGYGQRVEGAEGLWEAWSAQFRTNAFRRPRPVQWQEETADDDVEGVPLFSVHPTSRIWIAVCVWEGRAECFVHRPAAGVTYRTCSWLRDEAWSEPRLFAGELTEDGQVWIEDVADRRLGDWAKRRAWCERWVREMAPESGWRVKRAEGRREGCARLLESPLDGFRVTPVRIQAANAQTEPLETVWRPHEEYDVGQVLSDGDWHLPRFPDVRIYRYMREQEGEVRCRCAWNARLRCWDVVAVL